MVIIIFASGIILTAVTCFALGIKVASWGDQSRQGRFDRLYQNQAGAWVEKFAEIQELYYSFIAAASESNSVKTEETLDLRNRIDEALNRSAILEYPEGEAQ
jgi:hypothetical protein